MRPHLIRNDEVPGKDLPGWQRFEQFVAKIAQVSKQEADKKGSEPAEDRRVTRRGSLK